jgi:Rps23 Pro-64 3,4-dihydroxylase Tpa1-like proline 4-hydroxylase
MDDQKLTAYVDEFPFPHMTIDNFYTEEELELIWEELRFYTKPGKLLEAEDYGGVVGYTSAKALLLDNVYKDYSNNKGVNYRSLSNILTVNRKLFDSPVLNIFADVHDCCCIANQSNHDITKVRYYHDGEGYDPHTDKCFQFLAFSYFYKEPKKFEGGQLYFPKYDYEIPCDNNSMIIFPGWVEHGVREVSIKDSDYFDGWGRYAITSFFGYKDKS